MARSLIDYTGQKIGLLLVIEQAGRRSGAVLWRCRCDCGNETVVLGSHLKDNHTLSCGCHRVQVAQTMGANNRTHGHTASGEYRCWRAMRGRCENPRTTSYPHYGAKGITVCERWKSFEAFLSDMGPRPSPQHSIDRIDNSLGYAPENCRWATSQEQARNRSSTRMVMIGGQTRSVVEWAEVSGVPEATLRKRVESGMEGQRLLETADLRREVDALRLELAAAQGARGE